MSALLDRDLLRLRWRQHRAFRALPCTIPIAICLGAGVHYGSPLAGMVAASGAFSVGSGAFQNLGNSRVATMLGATLGMAVSALGGSLVGHRGSPGTILNASWAGFGGGMLLTLGPGSSWIGQQWAIVAIVASGYPVGFGAELARLTNLPNGYWVPMTALLVLKPDFRQTFHRGLERVAGTLVGAALATLLVHAVRLDPLAMGCVIVFFAWLGYTLVNVYYAVYAVFLTAYIVFLLDFGGLTPAAVVTHRAMNTALGGGLALLSYVTVLIGGQLRVCEKSPAG